MEVGHGTSEYKRIAAEFAAAKNKQRDEVIPNTGKQKTATHFKSQHLAVLTFFSWILCVIPTCLLGPY